MLIMKFAHPIMHSCTSLRIIYHIDIYYCLCYVLLLQPHSRIKKTMWQAIIIMLTTATSTNNMHTQHHIKRTPHINASDIE